MESFVVITIFSLGLLYIKRLISYRLNEENGSFFNVLNYICIGSVFILVIIFVMLFERKYSIITLIIYILIYMCYKLITKK